MSTFTWSPAPGAAQQKTPKVRTSQFGDGYQQRVGDGINTISRAWTLTFRRLTADVDAIDAFLTARAGVESFDWTPPSGSVGKWICKSWSQGIPAMQLQEINATFEEVHGD